MAKLAQTLKGRKFGKLTAIRVADERNNSGSLMWVCQCECGGDRTTTVSALTSGNTRSCGCLKRQVVNQGEATYLDSRLKELSTIWLAQPLVAA